MKKTFKSGIARTCFQMVACAVFFAVAAQSQQQKKDFGALAMSGPNEIIVLIARNVLHPSTASATSGWAGYNIYRKAADEQEYRKLNPEPLTRANTLREFDIISRGSSAMLANMLKTPGAEGLWELITKNDPRVVTLSLFDPHIREALGLLWRDREVRQGVAYTYAVAMVDPSGKESERTAPTSATFGLNPNPLKGPLSVTIGADDKAVSLRWKANPADKTALGYNVYRAHDRDGRFERLNDRPIVIFTTEDPKSEAVASFKDTSIYPGRAHYYCVVARDFAGNESPRAPLLEITPRDTTAPGSPQGVLVRSSGNGLTITWERVNDEDLLGYHIYRSGKGADGPYARITDIPVPPDTGIYEDGKVSPEKQYFYEVTALDRAGNESLRSARGLATYQDFRPPLPPQDVSAEGRKDGILIKWEPNAGENIQGHVVYRAESMDGALAQVSPLIRKDTSEYMDRDKHLSPRGAYWYLVQAVSISGVLSPLSAPAIATVDATEGPEAPLDLRGYHDESGTRLFWSASRDNLTTGYIVERAAVDKKPKWTALTARSLPHNQVAFTDSDAEPGKAHMYRVRAVNKAGMQSPPSQALTLQSFTPPPLPPGGIMVTRIPRGVRIAWDPSREPSVAGYNVYRSAGKGGAVKLNARPLPSSASFYEDNKVKKGAFYMYSISCVSADGREGSRSEPVQFTIR